MLNIRTKPGIRSFRIYGNDFINRQIKFLTFSDIPEVISGIKGEKIE